MVAMDMITPTTTSTQEGSEAIYQFKILQYSVAIEPWRRSGVQGLLHIFGWALQSLNRIQIKVVGIDMPSPLQPLPLFILPPVSFLQVILEMIRKPDFCDR